MVQNVLMNYKIATIGSVNDRLSVGQAYTDHRKWTGPKLGPD